jgi:hypothetical protein
VKKKRDILRRHSLKILVSLLVGLGFKKNIVEIWILPASCRTFLASNILYFTQCRKATRKVSEM